MSAFGRLASTLDKQIKDLNGRIEAMRKGAVTTRTNGVDDTAQTIARDLETVSQLMIVRSGIPHY
jgi:hypothetical protein